MAAGHLPFPVRHGRKFHGSGERWMRQKIIYFLKSCCDEIDPVNILVSHTTSPEIIIACQKAAAIITDTGGLLSHAAIVSREFDIPCIVGTERASKQLHDGDLVEVDAKIGSITLLA